MAIEAVIWDMGGVIVRTEDPSGRLAWEQKLGLAPGELSQRVFDGRMARRATVGEANAADVWAQLARQFNLNSGQRQQLEADFWRGDQVDQRLLGYIRSLRPGRQTALLSNAWPEVRQLIEDRWQFADAFDVIVLSAEVRLAKPDPTIYQVTLERLGVPAEHTLFIDDFEENVRGARQVGMHALRFESTPQVLAELENRLT